MKACLMSGIMPANGYTGNNISAIADGNGYEDIVNEMRMADEALRFDSIAVTGISGMLIGPMLAMTLGKGLIIVRKGEESCHSYSMVEGNPKLVTKGPQRYIIVDDCYETWSSVGRMVREIHKTNGCIYAHRFCVGAFFYNKLGDIRFFPANLVIEKLSIRDSLSDINVGAFALDVEPQAPADTASTQQGA